MTDSETLGVYAARAADYADLAAQERPRPHLKAFLAQMPDGARILDLGCGTGEAAAIMAASGYKVDAWDASPQMAEEGHARNGVDITVAAFDALDAVDTYDGIYANFSLLHAPKSEMPGHLARIARALKTKGLFHIGLKTGDGEKRDSLGRFYAYYQDAEMTNLLTDAGMEVECRSFGVTQGLDGQMAPWIMLRARLT